MWIPVEAPEGYEAVLVGDFPKPGSTKSFFKLWAKLESDELYVFIGEFTFAGNLEVLIRWAEAILVHPVQGVKRVRSVVTPWHSRSWEPQPPDEVEAAPEYVDDDDEEDDDSDPEYES